MNKILHKALPCALALCILLQLAPAALAGTTQKVTPNSNAISYPDVASNSWMYAAVKYATNAGYVSGYPDGTFRPANDLTKAEIIKILHNMEHLLPPLNMKLETNPYKDVQNRERYFYLPVCWASKIGIASVIEEDGLTFGFNHPVKRVQIAELIYQYACNKGWVRSTSVSLPYTDTAGLNGDQIKALKWCYANSIMVGMEKTKFSPHSNMNRAQFAKLLHNIDTFVINQNKKAFCVGTKYDDNFFKHVDTSAAATTARDCYQKMGYSVTCSTAPTTKTMYDSHNLKSKIVLLCGHGAYNGMLFHYMTIPNATYRTGVYFEKDTEVEKIGVKYRVAGIEGKMGLVDLIVFGGCSTADKTQTEHLAKNAAKFGAKVSIGWQYEVDPYDSMVNWLERFNKKLATGATVKAAIAEADRYTYWPGSNIKDWAVYYTDYAAYATNKLSLNSSSVAEPMAQTEDAPENLLASYRGSTSLCGADLSAETAAILRQIVPGFDMQDYTAQLYDHGEAGTTIDFTRVIGGFATDSGYVAMLDADNTLTAIYDNTKEISAQAEARVDSLSNRLGLSLQTEASSQAEAASDTANPARTATLNEALRLAWEETNASPLKEATHQRHYYFYDTERKQPCILVYTTYFFDGTEAKGVDTYCYDLDNREVVS